MKIMLAIPTDKYIETACFESIYNMDKCGHDVEMCTCMGYGVDTARNILAEEAINNEYDYVLWVDSDMVIPADALKRLLSHGKDIVSGLYSYKVLLRDEVCCLKKVGDRYGNYKASEIVKLHDLLEVDAFGFGCALTSVKALKSIKEPRFVFKQDLGEDIYFCIKAKEAGFSLYADPNVLCGHIGYVNYNLKGGEQK